MSRKSIPPPLSELQACIMDIVWQHDEVTVTKVWGEICRRRRLARNTVQTVMSRLEEKGWLRHREDGKAFVYRACVERSRAGRQLVSRLVDTVFSGSAEGLVLALLDDRGLTPEEAARIRRRIEQEERKR